LAKDLNKHSSKEDINRHVNNCSAGLAIMGVQVRTTESGHNTCSDGCIMSVDEGKEPSLTIGGNVN
jgi:hypothetical protein